MQRYLHLSPLQNTFLQGDAQRRGDDFCSIESPVIRESRINTWMVVGAFV